MRQRLPPLNGLKAFEAAARHSSFVGAAAELGVTPAAVSQQVRALEHYLERRLFERQNNGITLSDAGLAVFPAIAQGFEHFLQATRSLREGNVPVRLTVSTLPSVAVKWLAPRVARFLDAQPDLHIALRVDADPIDFTRDDVDLRLSYGSQHYPELVVEELVTDRVLPLCRARLADGASAPAGPRELLDCTLIHTDWGPAFATHPTWADWFRAVGIDADFEVGRGHRVSMSSVAIDLAAAGVGVALGQELLACDDLAAGRLINPLGPALKLKAPYCVAYPHAKAKRSALTTFLDWLRAEAIASYP